MVEFNNKRFGRCIILKEDKYFDYKLILLVNCSQYAIIYGFDKENSSWIDGHYYGKNIELAIKEYLIIYKETMKKCEER